MKRSSLLALTLATGLVGTALAEDFTVPDGTVYTNSVNPLASGTTIIVPNGAAFDLHTTNSVYKSYDYTFKLAGTGPDGQGALRDTGTVDPAWDDVQVREIQLDGDALIKSSVNMSVIRPNFGNAQIRLNEHTLRLVFDDEKSMIFAHTAPWDTKGTIRVENGGVIVKNITPNSDDCNFEQATVIFDGPQSWLKLDGEYSIIIFNELLMENGAKLLGNGTFVINCCDNGFSHGTFKPSRTTYPDFTGTMSIWCNDSDPKGDFTLDLTRLSGTWTFPRCGFRASWTPKIIVKPGTWATGGSQGCKLISWTSAEKPDLWDAKSTFALDSSIDSSWGVEKCSDGAYLYLKSTAYWAQLNGPSWKYYTHDWGSPAVLPSVPTKEQTVYFNDYSGFMRLRANASSFSAREIQMRDEFSLNGNTDLTGLDFYVNCHIKMNGYHLTMPARSLAVALDGWLDGGGELELNVPEGQSEVVKSYWYRVDKLIKSGKGRLVIETRDEDPKSVEVKEGELAKKTMAGWNTQVFGPSNSTIRVENGARIDLGDRNAWFYDYEIAGDGPDGMGAITASAVESNWGFISTGDHGCLRHLTLADDASADALPGKPWPLSFWSNTDHDLYLNGHTFTVGMTEFVYWVNLQPKDTGKVVIGNVEVYGRCKPAGATQEKIGDKKGPNVDMSNVDVEVKHELVANSGCFFSPVKSLKYEPDAKYRHSSVPEGGEYYVNTVVHGTYRPSTNAMPTVTLGAAGHTRPTLDLSTQPDVLDGSRLDFYEKALVTIDMGERSVTNGQKLVSWSSKPSPHVAFRLKYKELGRCRAEAFDDGLYVTTGFTLYVR